MTWLAWAGVIAGLIIALIGGYFGLMGQRSQARSHEKVAQLSADGSAGQLALSLAQNSQARLITAEQKIETFEIWEDEIEYWWEHDDRPWHVAVRFALANVDPDVVSGIPPTVPIPRRRKNLYVVPDPK